MAEEVGLRHGRKVKETGDGETEGRRHIFLDYGRYGNDNIGLGRLKGNRGSEEDFKDYCFNRPILEETNRHMDLEGRNPKV